jgi:hypothetical protein
VSVISSLFTFYLFIWRSGVALPDGSIYSFPRVFPLLLLLLFLPCTCLSVGRRSPHRSPALIESSNERAIERFAHHLTAGLDRKMAWPKPRLIEIMLDRNHIWPKPCFLTKASMTKKNSCPKSYSTEAMPYTNWLDRNFAWSKFCLTEAMTDSYLAISDISGSKK